MDPQVTSGQWETTRNRWIPRFLLDCLIVGSCENTNEPLCMFYFSQIRPLQNFPYGLSPPPRGRKIHTAVKATLDTENGTVPIDLDRQCREQWHLVLHVAAQALQTVA